MTPRDLEPADPDDDDAALSWAGDDLRGQAAPRLRGDVDATPAPADEPRDEPAAPRSGAERATAAVTIVFGLVYLALSIGWIFSAQLLVYPGLDLLGEIMWQFGEFLAMVAPALWFAAVLTFTPEGVLRRALTRLVALLAGALVLVPWPAIGYWIGSMQ